MSPEFKDVSIRVMGISLDHGAADHGSDGTDGIGAGYVGIGFGHGSSFGGETVAHHVVGIADPAVDAGGGGEPVLVVVHEGLIPGGVQGVGDAGDLAVRVAGVGGAVDRACGDAGETLIRIIGSGKGNAVSECVSGIGATRALVVPALTPKLSVLTGAGPRATHSSRALAAISGRDYVSPDDIKAMALPVLEHRLILRPEYEIEGLTVRDVIGDILKNVAVPR